MRAPILTAAVVIMIAESAAASPAAGRWRTQENGGVVEITDCGGGICGRVLTSTRLAAHPDQVDAYNRDPALRSRPIRGLSLFEDMRGGPSIWRGRVYNPADGGTYAGTVTVTGPDALRLRGCIIFPLCKTQVWTRLR